jgi:hypothetical protein
MGYYKNSRGVECFSPDSDEETLYICSDGGISFEELWDQIRWYFETPEKKLEMSDITISTEIIHTRAIYHDLMDWSDWNNYIVITKNS